MNWYEFLIALGLLFWVLSVPFLTQNHPHNTNVRLGCIVVSIVAFVLSMLFAAGVIKT